MFVVDIYFKLFVIYKLDKFVLKMISIVKVFLMVYRFCIILIIFLYFDVIIVVCLWNCCFGKILIEIVLCKKKKKLYV